MTQDAAAGAISLNPDVVSAVVEDGAVLLDLDSKYFYHVNPSGWAIVQLLESGTTRQLVLQRCAGWGMGNGDAADIGGFLAGLAEHGLLASSDQISPAPEVGFDGAWSAPVLERQREPLQRIMVSAFDPTIPLLE